MTKKKILLTILSFAYTLGFAQTNKQVLFTSKNQSDVKCYRIPSIVTTAKGTLIAAIDERVPNCGDLLYNPNINIVIRTSDDKGKTWSEIKRVVDFPDQESASDVSMVLDEKTKEIYLFYNYMNHKIAKNEFRLHFVKSADNGETWSKPIDITDQITPTEWKKDFKFITSGRGTYTKEGWILNTLVRLKDGVYVFGSKDHGKTWERISSVAEKADETNIVQLPNKDWMLNARIQNAGFRKIFISKDQGKTWTSKMEEQLIDPTCNASTLVLGKDIVFSNLHDPKDRQNLGLKVSKDQAKTWNFIKTIEPNSSAYSVLTNISKNKVGIFYEADDYQDMVFEVVDLK
ncbi:sialidase family protein [Empedobacter falsenii]